METALTLEINGERRSVPQLPSVRALLAHLRLKEERIAVELNSRILRREEWERTPLRDRDRIEIVQFVGGG